MEARRTPRTQPQKNSLAQEYLVVDAIKLEHLDITTEVLAACGQEIFGHSKYEENKTGSGIIYPTYYLHGWQTRFSYQGNTNQVSIPRVFVKIKATGAKCRFNQSMMCVCGCVGHVSHIKNLPVTMMVK
jgi:hypothetical protein